MGDERDPESFPALFSDGKVRDLRGEPSEWFADRISTGTGWKRTQVLDDLVPAGQDFRDEGAGFFGFSG